MKLAIIGATGFVGSAVVTEALQRGHSLSAIVRTTGKLPTHPALRPVAADINDTEALAAILAGHDAVISAYNPGWAEPEIYAKMVRGSQAILDAVRQSGVRRLLVVGGAGSLEVAPGVQLIDTPQFPAEYKQGALGAREALLQLRADTRLDWSFLSPPALLAPGERRERYRVGDDQLLMDGDHPAGISVATLAVAILDEIERPQHLRRRFTVAS